MTNKKFTVFLMALSLALTVSHCKKDDPPAAEEPGTVAEYDDTPYNVEYGAFAKPDFKDNPLTVEGVKLGRMLFYEKNLSKDGSISCASCHKQENAFSDPRQFSEGVGGLKGKRQAMAIFNTAWHTNEFFWDGRAHLLRDQALKPIQDPVEMNETLENMVAKLESDKNYTDQFIRAFGDGEVSAERVSLALEQFMNSIVSNRSKYDRFLAGEATLTDSEERGRVLFFAEYNPGFPEVSGADCAHCHGGNNFDNNRYMNNGLDEEATQTDIGREKVSGSPEDRAKFKVPSLRNVALTAPYMHDGRFTTLEEVVAHYDHGIKSSPTVDPALAYTAQTGLMLTVQDKADLIAFLKTLTDEPLTTDERYSAPSD